MLLLMFGLAREIVSDCRIRRWPDNSRQSALLGSSFYYIEELPSMRGLSLVIGTVSVIAYY